MNRMSTLFRRVLPLAALVAVLVALISAAPAAAKITSGSCTATGTGGYQGDFNITSQDVWHVKDSDQIGGKGLATTSQKAISVAVVMGGVPFTIIQDTGSNTSGTAGPYSVHSFDRFARVFTVRGGSTDCTGQFTVVVDDISPYTTYAGILSLILIVLGLLILLWQIVRGSGVAARIFGIIGGLLLGVGLAVLLIQLDVIDGASVFGLVIVIACVAAGLLLTGWMHAGRSTSAPARP